MTDFPADSPELQPPAAVRWAGTLTKPVRFDVCTCLLYSGETVTSQGTLPTALTAGLGDSSINLVVEVRRRTSTPPGQEAQDR